MQRLYAELDPRVFGIGDELLYPLLDHAPSGINVAIRDPPADENEHVHLEVLEEVEWTSIPGLVEVLREEGLVAARHVLWDATGWQRDYP
jgi:hypothetical protein